MKQSEKSAPETKAKRCRCFRLVEKGRIVQLQLFQCISQIPVLCAIGRIHTAIYHRVDFFITRKCFGTRTVCIGYGITHAGVTYVFDAGCNIAYHSGRQFVARNQTACSKVAHLDHFLDSTCRHHADSRSFFHTSFHHTAGNDNTAVRIVNGIKNQCL